MPVWKEFNCYWLETQIQRNYAWKVWYALKAYIIALCIIWRYDIIHFHTVPDVSMKIQFPIMFLALLGRKKIIMHLHVGNQLSMAKYTKNKFSHWCLRHADAIVLLAYRFESLLKEYWKDVKVPTKVIYNACKNKTNEHLLEKRGNNILFVGRFTSNKAADVLIRAFAIVHKKYPEWRIKFLADGPEWPTCVSLIKELGVEDKIDLPGFLFGKEKDTCFLEADIFCLCSYYEGFPMVVLEAWSYGLPVVSTPVGGLPDVVREGSNGFFYNYGDVAGLAEKLDLLMGNPELRKNMGAYSREFVKSTFSPEIISKQISNLYNNLL